MATVLRSTHRARRSRVPWWCLLLGLSACGGGKPADQIRRAASWAATTREIAIERGLQHIGRAYALDLLESGQGNVRETVARLSASTLPPGARGAPDVIRQLDAVMTQATVAIRQGSPGSLGAAGAAASALGSRLDALAAAAEAP